VNSEDKGRFQKVVTAVYNAAGYAKTKPEHGDILIYHGSEPGWTNLSVGKDRTVLMTQKDTTNGIGWVSPQVLDVSTEVGTACSDETSPLTTGIKSTFRMPHGMRFYASTGNAGSDLAQATDGPGLSASVTSFPSGQAILVDILESGQSLFQGTNYLRIEPGQKTSKTALVGYTLDTSTAPRANKLISGLAYDAEITVIARQVGGTTPLPWPGAGLKVQIRGMKGNQSITEE
jgi:hypothetical protein